MYPISYNVESNVSLILACQFVQFPDRPAVVPISVIRVIRVRENHRPERAASFSPGHRPGLYVPPQKNCALQGQHLFLRHLRVLPHRCRRVRRHPACDASIRRANHPCTNILHPHLYLAELTFRIRKKLTHHKISHQNYCPIKEK